MLVFLFMLVLPCNTCLHFMCLAAPSVVVVLGQVVYSEASGFLVSFYRSRYLQEPPIITAGGEERRREAGAAAAAQELGRHGGGQGAVRTARRGYWCSGRLTHSTCGATMPLPGGSRGNDSTAPCTAPSPPSRLAAPLRKPPTRASPLTAPRTRVRVRPAARHRCFSTPSGSTRTRRRRGDRRRKTMAKMTMKTLRGPGLSPPLPTHCSARVW